MQLTIITIAIVLFMFVDQTKAQLQVLFADKNANEKKTSEATEMSVLTYERTDWQKIDIDFLTSYYSQDGNNAAVTGGIGTEQLTDFTQKLNVNIPLNPKLDLQVEGAYDYYSSASTDNIDNIRSSDSKSDVRSQVAVGAQYTKSETFSYGGRVGTSVEYDYFSFNTGGNFSISNKSQNSRLDVQGQVFLDKWSVIFPAELRGEVSVPTDLRQSYNGAISFSQILSRRFQFSISGEATYMNGLLSTPFHRVYFNNTSQATIEKLPSTRLKLPIGIRMNYHLSEKLILRSYYRYYWDSWGMNAHTFSVELPYKINRFMAIYPHYRYHMQSAIDYFQPYKTHRGTESFYTSDFDLSALSSQSFGLGFMYGPPEGLAKMNMPFTKRKFVLDGVDVKASYYLTSTGLNSFIISVGTKFSF